jgi:hypothetical protein
MNASPKLFPSILQQTSIPNIIHFIYVGGRPFSFIHFLAVYMAKKINQPDRILFHHTELPCGHWWEKAKPLLTLNPVEPVTEVYGNPVKYLAHMADVIRLAMLKQYGGIYLDLDVISLRPFTSLRQHDFVMGIESGTGLCNAVILAKANSAFLHEWQQQYRSFDATRWNYHSVLLPWVLAQKQPSLIHIVNKYAFFYPTHNDPVHRYLWGQAPSWKEKSVRITKNLIKLFSGSHDMIRQAFYQTFHALYGVEWHYRQAQKSYCLHLWEGLWGECYLQVVTPEYLRHSPSNFARLLRNHLSNEDLIQMEQ